MEGIYISVSRVDKSVVWCNLDSMVILFVYQYLGQTKVLGPLLNLVVDASENDELINVNISGLGHVLIRVNDLDDNLRKCHLPIFYTPNEKYIIAGFCAVLRQLVKTFQVDRSLLAFREACLSCCAENSIWTKFCEIDLIKAVRQCLTHPSPELPVDILRLEHHMSQPVRTHNIRKAFSKFPSSTGLLDHCYVEGPEMFLPDLIIFPLVHIFFGIYGVRDVPHSVPLVRKWYELMLTDNRVLASMIILEKTNLKQASGDLTVPVVKKESLYKCDPKRHKASEKLFTKQEDIEHAAGLIDAMSILDEYDYKERTFNQFEWDAVPFHAQPKGGNLPAERLQRKMQQIENVVAAVLKIAENEDTIVDFCCGTGHVGILIAYLLPKCHILLIDNKEHCMRKAEERIKNLCLENVTVIQSNVDYFNANFEIGVTLHACGIATDLVIKSCILNRSKFVVSPCCYGKLQTNHILSYPRSERFICSSMMVRDYMVLGHSADQTHKDVYAKSDQGEKCMKIIDVDRCLHAEECDYRVYLAKMKPTSCSPKNNLIVGVPREKFKECYFEE